MVEMRHVKRCVGGKAFVHAMHMPACSNQFGYTVCDQTLKNARLEGPGCTFSSRLCSYHVLITYSADWNGPKVDKNLAFLGLAETLLCFQARCSSATCSSTSDLTV